MTTGERGLWALVAAGVAHVLEEFVLDWRTWASDMSGMHLTWPRFWFINAGFIAFAVCAAWVGWRVPRISLSLPCLVLLNGVGFHLGPTLVMGHISPGVFTATLLYVPLGSWTLWRARRDGLLGWQTGLVAAGLGAGVMSLPFVFLAVG